MSLSEERKNNLKKASDSFWGGKPGPKVFKEATEFFDYALQRLEKDRTDIDTFIKLYKAQPFYIRLQAARSPVMADILQCMVIDKALGVNKMNREEWNALSRWMSIIQAERIEEIKNERKAINKESVKFIKPTDKGRFTTLDVQPEE